MLRKGFDDNKCKGMVDVLQQCDLSAVQEKDIDVFGKRIQALCGLPDRNKPIPLRRTDLVGRR